MLSDYEKILSRLKEVLNATSDADVARGLGISTAALSSFKKQGKFPYERLAKFCLARGVSIDWLFTGEGGMMRAPEARPLVGSGMRPYEGKLLEVPVYALAGAGPPRLNSVEPIDTLLVPKDYMQNNHIVPVRVQGESMETTFYDGATVGVDTTDRKLISGKIYAVWLAHEGAVIKRLFVEPERIILKSDNLNFPPAYINISEVSDFLILGRVKWVIQKL